MELSIAQIQYSVSRMCKEYESWSGGQILNKQGGQFSIYSYVVTNRQTGSPTTKWWDGATAVHVDFTKPAAVTWFKNRLQLLRNAGIDSFKFDAGETSWAPSVSTNRFT